MHLRHPQWARRDDTRLRINHDLQDLLLEAGWSAPEYPKRHQMLLCGKMSQAPDPSSLFTANQGTEIHLIFPVTTHCMYICSWTTQVHLIKKRKSFFFYRESHAWDFLGYPCLSVNRERLVGWLADTERAEYKIWEKKKKDNQNRMAPKCFLNV